MSDLLQARNGLNLQPNANTLLNWTCNIWTSPWDGSQPCSSPLYSPSSPHTQASPISGDNSFEKMERIKPSHLLSASTQRAARKGSGLAPAASPTARGHSCSLTPAAFLQFSCNSYQTPGYNLAVRCLNHNGPNPLAWSCIRSAYLQDDN